MTIPQGGESPFMPTDSGTILYTVDASGRCLRLPGYDVIPCPPGAVKGSGKPEPTPKGGAANTAGKPTDANTAPTPKPLATPPPRTDPAANRAANTAVRPTPRPTEKKPDE